MYIPEFPYKGKQVLISSDRIHIQGRNDSVLLLGKQSVALSSQNSINIDATKSVTIDCIDIKIGSLQAKDRVILGDKFVKDFKIFLECVITASDLLTKVSAGQTAPNPELGTSMTYLATAGKMLNKQAQNLLNNLESSLSKRVKVE